MDAFYASVEIRQHPELAGRPVVVAGGSPTGDRGVVLSASYQARAFGVRSAMPVAHARRLCPQAEFVPPHFPRYAEVSQGAMALFNEITPLVEPLPALRRAVGAASAHHLHELANGRDDRRVVPNLPEKSVGAEQTFARDEADRTALRRELLRLVDRATAALRRRGLRGRTIALKI